MDDPGDLNDYEKDNLDALDARDAEIEAEAQEREGQDAEYDERVIEGLFGDQQGNVEVPQGYSNPFSAEYFEREFGGDKSEPFTETRNRSSMTERLMAIASGTNHDCTVWRNFKRMFDETELPQLRVIIDCSELEQQLIQQGLTILAILEDDPTVADTAFALYEKISDQLNLVSASMPQEQFDARGAWQANDNAEQFAKALGFDNVQEMKAALQRAAEEAGDSPFKEGGW